MVIIYGTGIRRRRRLRETEMEEVRTVRACTYATVAYGYPLHEAHPSIDKHVRRVGYAPKWIRGTMPWIVND